MKGSLVYGTNINIYITMEIRVVESHTKVEHIFLPTCDV